MNDSPADAHIRIRDKTIGRGHPVYIVAEAGSNHNGQQANARALIDAAADAGADAIKFQTFEARRLYPRTAGTSDYLGSSTPIYDIIEAMEMPAEWLPALRDHAHGRGLALISSPFHEEAVPLLSPYVDAYKIASYELTHTPLLAAVAGAGKPVIMSTGASTLEETRVAVEQLRRSGCRQPVVLQCTAAYPAPPESANVRAVATLAFDLDVLSGLSDHTRDPVIAPAAATALGAVMIEKHFTLDNDLPGPDHAFAIEPDELSAMVYAIRATEQILGTGEKSVQAAEDELRHFARRSIFATRPIRAGEAFSRANVDILRHGQNAAGLPPDAIADVVGRVAARDIAAGTALQSQDVSPQRA